MFDPIEDMRSRVKAADLRVGHLLLHDSGTHLIENTSDRHGKRTLTLRNIRTGETSTVETSPDAVFRHPILMPSVVAAAIDAIDGREDPEHAHGLLDAVLLNVAPPEVQEAAERLAERTRWWGSA